MQAETVPLCTDEQSKISLRLMIRKPREKPVFKWKPQQGNLKAAQRTISNEMHYSRPVPHEKHR